MQLQQGNLDDCLVKRPAFQRSQIDPSKPTALIEPGPTGKLQKIMRIFLASKAERVASETFGSRPGSKRKSSVKL